MPVNPTGSVNSTAPSATETTRNQDTSILGKDDFLKLLIGQMQNQDPLNPTDGAEYMGQMTQFSILEQITNLGQTTSAAASNDYDQHAINLIGKEVTYLRMDGSTLRSYNGRVESVTFTNAGPQLRITGDADKVAPVSVTYVWGEGTTPNPDPLPDPRAEETGGTETPAAGSTENP